MQSKSKNHMKNFTPILVVIFLSACFDYNPFELREPHERRGITLSNVQHVPHQEDLLRLFQNRVEDHFDVDLGRAWAQAVVYWVSDDCGKTFTDARSTLGVEYRGDCYHGVMFGCDELYVAHSSLNPYGELCHTALVHEFAHCLNGYLEGHYDSAHAAEIWERVPPMWTSACAWGW